MAPEQRVAASATLRVRAFRLTDLASVSEILRSSAEAAQWPLESYAKLADSAHGFVLVCDAADRAVGFLAAARVAEEAEVLNIAVHSDFRRKGAATLLMAAALEKFRASAITSVFLELRESNAPARALYSRLGFVFSGRRKAYYRDPTEDALCMQKKLTGISP